MTKENLLVTLADKNYINQAKQLFSSAYWNAGWKGDYMLLAHEIPEKELRWFRNKGILIKKCKPLAKKGWGNWPSLLLDKFYLFTPEFKKWKNIIFLDTDIIVRASLDDLTKVKEFGAVEDIFYNKLIYQVNGKKLKNDLNYTFLDKLKGKEILRKKAFNAGVFVFNTNIIKEDTFEKLMGLFEKYGKYSFFGEQFVFNLFFSNKWKQLPLVYNTFVYQAYYFNSNPKNQKGILLHFTGLQKPWTYYNPFHKEWKYNLERAELIDLNNLFLGKKSSKIKILFYSFYLRIVYFYFVFYPKLKKYFNYIINTPNRLIGKIGILLRRYNLDLYNKFKKIEIKIRK